MKITLYRGLSRYNKNGRYYTTEKEWARQFTQSGQDHEIISAVISDSDILRLDPLPHATSESDFDKALATARAQGYAAVWFDEGPNQPNSVYVLTISALRPAIKSFREFLLHS